MINDKEGYRVRFDADSGYTTINDLNGFKLQRTAHDSVFGWLQKRYVQILIQDYKRWVDNTTSNKKSE